MSDLEFHKISKDINSDNYLINCYNHLTRLKIIHFLMIIIELILNIVYELEILLRDFQFQNVNNKNLILNYISSISNIYHKIPPIINFIILFLFVFILDSLSIFLKKRKFKEKHIGIIIIADLLEIFFFRTSMIFFLNFFFIFNKEYFLISCIFVIPHIYFIMNNFMYNHLYYFIPKFIKYPYDEFSSLYDIIMLIIKILLSISGTTNNYGFSKFCFFILFFLQILFSFYFINLLKIHSYLFMKNSFLNRTRICFFFTKTIIILLALLFEKNEILRILFLVICISVLLINMSYIYFLYNPYLHIKVKRETPMNNILFYLFLLSEKNDYDFLFENKIKDHCQKCGICDLCNKYNKYFKFRYNTKSENDEKEKLINEENKIDNNENNKDKSMMDLFDIVYNNNNKYFELIKKIVFNYRHKGKKVLTNTYYYLNLSLLIYSDYHHQNLTLSLNERILLEVLNKENRIIFDNHESQINQLLFCNNFIDLSYRILSQLKDILNSEPNSLRGKKLIDLSYLLKKMKNKKYRDYLFSHKLENIINSKYLILICSIVYEEIFNTTLNNSQYPIRENIQSYEDIFNFNKINKLISLGVDLASKKSKIIRAGKDLSTHINKDLFDLFPLIFKQYQINMFMSIILNDYDTKENKENINNSSIIKKDKKIVRITAKNARGPLKDINNNYKKNKDDYIDINLIIAENYASKMYYKLLSLKLSPLFNKNNHHFILFDGLYLLHKNTIITLQDFEKNLNAKEILIGFSEPYLEKPNEVYSIPFNKYISWQNSQGYISSKMASLNLSLKLYNIYGLNKKEKETKIKKMERKSGQSKGIKNEEEEEISLNKKKNKNKIEKMILIEDNASVSSVQVGNNYNNEISSIGVRNKKKDDIYEYGGFNKIRKIIYLVLFITLSAYIFDYFFLDYLKNTTSNNNNALLQYREINSLYFQLFTSILGVTCIFNSLYINRTDDCLRLVDIFTNFYFQNNNKSYFNFSKYSLIQNEILCKEMMEKRNNLLNIHKNIGNKHYNELFGKEIHYSRITQSIYNGKSYYNLSKINMKFSEALLLICNSFQSLTTVVNNSVTLLNKTEDPFSASNSQEKRGIFIISENHKLFYEIIINYKVYNKELEEITDKLTQIITSKSLFIEIFIYFGITLDLVLIMIIGISLLIYTICFENILIKIINYINMVINEKNDNFNFYEIYLKKIENLEAILQYYKVSPSKIIQNLNEIYNNYQQYLTVKNKSNATDKNIKKYKKIMNDNKKSELEDIPKNQRIITKKDVKTLGITFKYRFIFWFVFFLIVVLYVGLLYIWANYFSKKKNLYNLMIKNMSLEMSTYRAINAYQLMIFDNLTIDDVSEIVLPNKKDAKNLFLSTLYNDLKLAFNSRKEKKYIIDIYSDFEDKSNFTCERLFYYNSDRLHLLENHIEAKSLKNILNNLVNICEFLRITETNDFRIVFERHFQYTKKGMLSLNDFSVVGRLLHIVNDQSLPGLSLYFNIIVINIVNIIYTIPHKDAINNLIQKMGNQLAISQIFLFLSFIAANLLIFFFYFRGINNLCNQIIILRKIFKIFDMQE